MEWDEVHSPTPSRPWPSETSDLFAVDSETPTTAFPGWRRSSDDPWFGYVEGYRLAAQAILNHVETTGLDQDSLVFPFLMCWRHYVELQLKSLINLMQKGLQQPVQVPRGHRLDKLWSEAKLLFDQIDAFPEGDQATTRHVERLILQLHAPDPTAQEARYPITTQGSPTLDNIHCIDLRAFHLAMEGVANYFTGSAVGLTDYFERRDEIARETYWRYGDW